MRSVCQDTNFEATRRDLAKLLAKLKKESSQNNGYLLNKQGYGGLGMLYVDVLMSGAIQISSNSIIRPYMSEERQVAARRSYLLVIEQREGKNRITLERSRFGGNDDFEESYRNRPSLEDVNEVLFKDALKIKDGEERKALERTLARIGEVFQP